MSEFDLHRYVIDLLRFTARRGVLYYHCPNGEYRSRRTGARLKAMGVLPGVADICIVIPPGRAYFLELKSATGRASADQRAFADQADAAGARYAICRSPEQAREILGNWGALQPGSMADIVRKFNAFSPSSSIREGG